MNLEIADLVELIQSCLREVAEEEGFDLPEVENDTEIFAACIAEGYGRFHYQENIQFCRQSRGSLYELIDHLDVALDCEYIDNKIAEPQMDSIKTAIRMLNGYIKYLRQRKENS